MSHPKDSATHFDQLGICQKESSLANALAEVGEPNENGNINAVSFIKATGLRLVPLGLRFLVFLPLIALYFISKPFGFLPEVLGEKLGNLHEFEAFGFFQITAAILFYALYIAVTVFKNGRYLGRPGMDLHFVKFGKICNTIKPGQRALVIDPRIKPHAAVANSPINCVMKPVSGSTRDSITHTFRGALVIQVTDSFKLLEQGGFSEFIKQLESRYESAIRERMYQHDAKSFSSFMIEPVKIPTYTGIEAGAMSSRLQQLGQQELTVELIENAAAIGEMDVSSIPLDHTGESERLQIIPVLSGLADSYGIKILDHIPLGNMIADDYLKALAKQTISDLIRLSQSASSLLSITAEEIEEETAAAVNRMKVGVLKVTQVVREISAITETVLDQSNTNATINARIESLQNLTESILAAVFGQLDSIHAELKSISVKTTGVESYLNELDGILTRIEKDLLQNIPNLPLVITDKLEKGTLYSDFDLVDSLLADSGLTSILEKIKANQQTDTAENDSKSTTSLAKCKEQLEKINTENLLRELTEKLSKVSSAVTSASAGYTPSEVEALMDKIAEDSGIQDNQQQPVKVEVKAHVA